MSQLLTDERVAEIEARLNAASPGPWQALVPKQDSDRWVVCRLVGCGDVPPEKFYVCVLSVGDIVRDESDASLIAHIPTDLRDLLSDRERLVAENERLRGIMRDQQVTIKHWQKFIHEVGVLLGCPDRTDAVLEAIGRSKARIAELESLVYLPKIDEDDSQVTFADHGASLIRRLYEAKERIAELEGQVEGWRPIESAPTDGTMMIGLVGSRACKIYRATHIEYENVGGTSVDTGQRFFIWQEVEADAVRPCVPIAWMPLPPAPDSSEG